jgi:hypothetical protein
VLYGGRLNVPCLYLENLVVKNVLKQPLNGSGLNCRIIVGGTIRTQRAQCFQAAVSTALAGLTIRQYLLGLWFTKTPSAGFQRNVTLLHPDRPGWFGVGLFFLNVADFTGVQAGCHFG